MLVASVLLLSNDATLTGTKERDVRVLSLVLQAVGFWIVAEGLRDVGLHFGSPAFLTRLRNYWAERPFLRRRVVAATGVAHGFAIVSASGTGIVRDVATQGAPIERRLEVLELEVASHRSELTQLRQTHQETRASLEEAIAEEAAKRSHGDAELERTITSTIAEGIALEWLGVGYFVVGLVLSSLAPEIALLIDYLVLRG